MTTAGVAQLLVQKTQVTSKKAKTEEWRGKT